MSIYCTGDDIGLGWFGADKEYKYLLDFLAAKPFKIVLVRGNHDHTGVIRNHSVPSTGNRDTVKLITGTLCNPVYGDKIYSMTAYSGCQIVQCSIYAAIGRL